jgi:hypothetical protein
VKVIPMRATWRDAVATGLVGAAATLYGAHAAGAHLPGLHAVRPIAAVIVGLGLLACVTAAWPLQDASSAYGRWVGALGAAAFVAGMIALIGGNEIALTALVGITVAMWITATARHLSARRPRINDRDLHEMTDREKVAR